ncbi:MAG TPA: hypothetical protein VME45_21150 [Stellaceae bacterium]|nr:hypothetical protein [Stellaceae bacterium]
MATLSTEAVTRKELVALINAIDVSTDGCMMDHDWDQVLDKVLETYPWMRRYIRGDAGAMAFADLISCIRDDRISELAQSDPDRGRLIGQTADHPTLTTSPLGAIFRASSAVAALAAAPMFRGTFGGVLGALVAVALSVVTCAGHARCLASFDGDGEFEFGLLAVRKDDINGGKIGASEPRRGGVLGNDTRSLGAIA